MQLHQNLNFEYDPSSSRDSIFNSSNESPTFAATKAELKRKMESSEDCHKRRKRLE